VASRDPSPAVGSRHTALTGLLEEATTWAKRPL
jgi:hypothetical protein